MHSGGPTHRCRLQGQKTAADICRAREVERDASNTARTKPVPTSVTADGQENIKGSYHGRGGPGRSRGAGRGVHPLQHLSQQGAFLSLDAAHCCQYAVTVRGVAAWMALTAPWGAVGGFFQHLQRLRGAPTRVPVRCG